MARYSVSIDAVIDSEDSLEDVESQLNEQIAEHLSGLDEVTTAVFEETDEEDEEDDEEKIEEDDEDEEDEK